jgi:hypothetical protein
VPIDIDQFKAATRPLADRVLEFLNKTPSQAYSLIELIVALEGITESNLTWLLALERMGGHRSKTWDSYQEAVAVLLTEGKIVEAQVRGITYYAVKQ